MDEPGRRSPAASRPSRTSPSRGRESRAPHIEPDRIEGTGRILVPFLARPYLWGAKGRPAPDRGHARGHRPGRRHRLDSTGRCHTVAPAATSRPSSPGPTADWSPGRPSSRYGLACPPSRARHRGPRPGPAGVLARRCARPGHAGAPHPSPWPPSPARRKPAPSGPAISTRPPMSTPNRVASKTPRTLTCPGLRSTTPMATRSIAASTATVIDSTTPCSKTAPRPAAATTPSTVPPTTTDYEQPPRLALRNPTATVDHDQLC